MKIACVPFILRRRFISPVEDRSEAIALLEKLAFFFKRCIFAAGSNNAQSQDTPAGFRTQHTETAAEEQLRSMRPCLLHGVCRLPQSSGNRPGEMPPHPISSERRGVLSRLRRRRNSGLNGGHQHQHKQNRRTSKGNGKNNGNRFNIIFSNGFKNRQHVAPHAALFP